MLALGDELVLASKGATREVTLIAPFVKVDALVRVLEGVAADLVVNVIARWNPVEIAVGVCDLEIFDVVSARLNSKLYVHPLLHAKLYRFDDVAFFGSANLTGKALGWAAPSNLELLHAHKDLLGPLLAFEGDLIRSAILVNATYRDFVKEQVRKVSMASVTMKDVFDAETHSVNVTWLPTCRTPERLWGVYAQGESARGRMVESAYLAAQSDLSALGIAKGLPQAQFDQQVAAVLDRMPLVQEIDAASLGGLTSETASRLIERAMRGVETPYPTSDMWEVLQAWMMFFFQNRYRREATMEVFRRGSTIG